jgi:hypothetical protein
MFITVHLKRNEGSYGASSVNSAALGKSRTSTFLTCLTVFRSNFSFRKSTLASRDLSYIISIYRSQWQSMASGIGLNKSCVWKWFMVYGLILPKLWKVTKSRPSTSHVSHTTSVWRQNRENMKQFQDSSLVPGLASLVCLLGNLYQIWLEGYIIRRVH